MSEENKNSAVEVDLRGLTCPEPVLRTKKLLDDPAVNKVEAIVENLINVNNLSRLAKSLKLEFVSSKNSDEDGSYTVCLSRNYSLSDPDSPLPRSGGSSKSELHESSKISEKLDGQVGTVVMLTKDRFGEGDPEFSNTLINLFLQTAFSSGQRPRAILMANTGVRLMAPDSPTLKVLNDFKKAGTDVLACGLCVEFYGLKGNIPVEQITNMFAISEYMFSADKVITP